MMLHVDPFVPSAELVSGLLGHMASPSPSLDADSISDHVIPTKHFSALRVPTLPGYDDSNATDGSSPGSVSISASADRHHNFSLLCPLLSSTLNLSMAIQFASFEPLPLAVTGKRK